MPRKKPAPLEELITLLGQSRYEWRFRWLRKLR